MIQYVEDIIGVASLDTVQRSLRAGLLMALGVSPETADRCDLRLQSLVWEEGEGVYRISFVHTDNWDREAVKVISQVGDITEHIRLLVDESGV